MECIPAHSRCQAPIFSPALATPTNAFEIKWCSELSEPSEVRLLLFVLRINHRGLRVHRGKKRWWDRADVHRSKPRVVWATDATRFRYSDFLPAPGSTTCGVFPGNSVSQAPNDRARSFAGDDGRNRYGDLQERVRTQAPPQVPNSCRDHHPAQAKCLQWRGCERTTSGFGSFPDLWTYRAGLPEIPAACSLNDLPIPRGAITESMTPLSNSSHIGDIPRSLAAILAKDPTT